MDKKFLGHIICTYSVKKTMSALEMNKSIIWNLLIFWIWQGNSVTNMKEVYDCISKVGKIWIYSANRGHWHWYQFEKVQRFKCIYQRNVFRVVKTQGFSVRNNILQELSFWKVESSLNLSPPFFRGLEKQQAKRPRPTFYLKPLVPRKYLFWNITVEGFRSNVLSLLQWISSKVTSTRKSGQQSFEKLSSLLSHNLSDCKLSNT